MFVVVLVVVLVVVVLRGSIELLALFCCPLLVAGCLCFLFLATIVSDASGPERCRLVYLLYYRLFLTERQAISLVDKLSILACITVLEHGQKIGSFYLRTFQWLSLMD